MRQKYISTGLFANLLGLESGAFRSGFRTILSTDIEVQIEEIHPYITPNPDSVFIREDIKNLHFGVVGKSKEYDLQAYLSKNNIYVNRGDVDLLMGGPVCFGMTFLNTKERSVFHHYNFLMLEMIRLVGEVQPKVVLMEQVPAIMTKQMRPFFYLLINAIEKIGNYHWACKKLNAENFDCNQSRERVIFILVRKDLDVLPSFPEPKPVNLNKQSAFNTIGAEIIKTKGFKKAGGREQRIIDGKANTFPTLTSGGVEVFRNNRWEKLTLADRKVLSHMEHLENPGVMSDSFLSDRLGLMVLIPFAEALCKHIYDNILEESERLRNQI